MLSIVDAHHHIWNPVSNQPDIGYKWLKDIGAPKPFGDPTPIQRDYLLEEFLSEPSPDFVIGASVHLQADGAIPYPVKETAFVDAMAKQQGHDIAIIGFVDLSSPDAEEVLLGHLGYDSVRGVRHILSRLDGNERLSFASEHYLRNSVWQKNFALLAKHGLSFDLQIYPEQIGEAVDFLKDHSAVPVNLDHAGSPHDQRKTGLALWKSAMEQISALDHVSVKLCGFGMFDPQWQSNGVDNLVHHLVDCFGTSRVMFGSNFPVEKLATQYGVMVKTLMNTLPHDEAIFQAVFKTNARTFYRLGKPQRDGLFGQA